MSLGTVGVLRGQKPLPIRDAEVRAKTEPPTKRPQNTGLNDSSSLPRVTPAESRVGERRLELPRFRTRIRTHLFRWQTRAAVQR